MTRYKILILFLVSLFALPVFAQDDTSPTCDIDINSITALLETAQDVVETDNAAALDALRSARSEIQLLITSCDNNPTNTLQLTLDDTSLKIAYPNDWVVESDTESAYFLANSTSIFERELFGSDPPEINSGEVLLFAILTPPDDMLPSESGDMLQRLDTVVDILSDTFSESTQPILIEHDLYPIGQVRFFMPDLWVNVTVVELKENEVFVVYMLLTAPSEMREWDETLTRIIDSMEFVELD